MLMDNTGVQYSCFKIDSDRSICFTFIIKLFKTIIFKYQKSSAFTLYTGLYGSAHDVVLEALLLRVRHLELVGAARHADDEVRLLQLPLVDQQRAQFLYHCVLLLLSAVRWEANADVLCGLLWGVLKEQFAERVCLHFSGALVVWLPQCVGWPINLLRVEFLIAHAIGIVVCINNVSAFASMSEKYIWVLWSAGSHRKKTTILKSKCSRSHRNFVKLVNEWKKGEQNYLYLGKMKTQFLKCTTFYILPDASLENFA